MIAWLDMQRALRAAASEPAPAPTPAPQRSLGAEESAQAIARRRGPSMRTLHAAAATTPSSVRWPTWPDAADDIIRREWTTLVARSRYAAARADHARAYLGMVGDNVVGAQGVQLQGRLRTGSGALAERDNDALEAAWQKWGERHADVTGQRTWVDVQLACIRAVARDGEALWRVIIDARLPYGVTLQEMDPVDLAVDVWEYDPSGRSSIRGGVEVDRYGRATAYHFRQRTQTGAYVHGGRATTRVPASEVIHVYVPELPGQTRGLPWMAATLHRLQANSDWTDAALTNARASAETLGFLAWREGSGGGLDPEDDRTEPIELELRPGTFVELPEGLEAQPAAQQFPASAFDSFYRHNLRAIAAGLGVSYNHLASDLGEVNYSSARVGLLSERDMWTRVQGWFVGAFCRRVFDAWVEPAILSGRVPRLSATTAALERIRESVSWQPRRWTWVDPKSEAAATIMSVRNGQRSVSDVIRDSGRDPETTWRELAGDIEAMRKAGLPEEFIAAVFAGAGKQNVESASAGQEEP